MYIVYSDKTSLKQQLLFEFILGDLKFFIQKFKIILKSIG